MDLVSDVNDFGAPEHIVNGPSSIEWISPHQVRVTYYVRRKEGLAATHHAIWDIDELVAAHEAYKAALPILMMENRMRLQLEAVSAH